jgi:hypothetical protein
MITAIKVSAATKADSPTERPNPPTYARGRPVPLIERISLRVVSPRFGIASVRFDAVNLHHLVVEALPDGKLRIRPPQVVTRSGRELGNAYALQPYAREAIEAAIAVVWERARAAESALPCLARSPRQR